MEAVPVEAVPVEAVPVEAVPVEAVPVEAVPVEAVPVEAVPVDVAPLGDGVLLVPAVPVPFGLMAEGRLPPSEDSSDCRSASSDA
jgi:hypothetical protein